MFEIDSTHSGNSFNNKGRRQYNNPSVFKQTKYLDDIEDILKKRKKQKKNKAVAFLKELELKKSEAIAHNLLENNLVSKQS
jgi:formate dehydrogenase maturation protein FdhE